MSSRRSRSGGQVDRDHVEPVIQVGAEPVGGDLGGQVLVGRRQQPGLERDRPGRPDRQDFLVLDRPQQLGLGRPRQLADLVEEDRAPAGRDEQPGVVAIGPGEGAADVAEELVLQQVVGDRRAVDRQEHLVRARARRRARRRATSSLPVPDSPVISTVLRVGPTLRIRVLTACIGGLSPTSASRSPWAWSCRRSAWFSSSSRR